MDREVMSRNLKKLFVIIFSCAVFGYLLKSGDTTYQDIELKKKLYMAVISIILLQIMLYLEILILRDELWVLEGSMKMIRELRDAFLEPPDTAVSSFKKYLVLINTLVITGFFVYLQKEQPKVQVTIALIMILLMLVLLLLEVMIIREKNGQICIILEEQREKVLKKMDEDFKEDEENNNSKNSELS
ncbi:hypothetical protein ACFL35_09235 [Candidatus Riflebacteria bacterium]